MTDEYVWRERATQEEMEIRAKFLIEYAEEHGPVTVRGLYYQAEVHGLPGITKADGDYNKIQQQVLKLRRSGRLPYGNIADLTRWMRKPTTFDSIEEALWNTAVAYRKALWSDTKDYVEIWCEKDALAGVIHPVTSEYDVPLMVTRGFTSETFVYGAMEARGKSTKNFFVYYLGDFDRAGQDAARSLEDKLARFMKGKPFNVYWQIIAVTEEQIQEMGLSTREPKRKSGADKNWPHDFVCELDAIPPDNMRDLVRTYIELHLPKEQFEILKKVEETERQNIRALVRKLDV
jgi:hypothetical protein